MNNHPTPPTEPNHTMVNTMATTQTPVAKLAATSIPVTVYNLVQGKFEGIPYPKGKPQEEEGPPASCSNNPQERQQPETAVTAIAPQNREDTPWPNTMPASTNLFDAGASWPILPTETLTVIKMEQAEKRTLPRLSTIPHTLVLKQTLE